MRIAKAAAAAGVVGIGLALGAVSPAFAAPQPPAGGAALPLDSVTATTQDLPDPQDLQDLQETLGGLDLDEKTGELKADNPTAPTAVVDDAAQGAVSMLGGLSAGAPTG
ncbi:hypothetical protein [Streptomyces longisporoflavus]|uniref:hypothetical protein n=1 Tax=Streptomyces longisporoflavus TaxID=28044 RepID=UPI00167D374D|nr:hypothetical protein [Streptomyces longisporoflavus]